MVKDKMLLKEVAQAARLREGPAGVADLLRQLYLRSPLSTSDLARRLGWPVPVTAAVRRELERTGLVERTPGGSALSAAGREFARDVMGLSETYDPLCPTCAGRRIVVDRARWADLLAQLDAVHRANPTVDTTLDQSHGTPETALRRALAMLHAGALEGKALLVLGDDDLVSVAVGLLGVQLAALTVLDVDRRFLDHIAAAGRDLGLAIQTVAHDLRRPLPPALRERFDTVETDPPYTVQGLRLFLSRGLEGLRPGLGRDLFVSYAPRDPQAQRRLLDTCVELGLAPYSVTPDFNRYVGSATLGNSGQFLHLRTTAEAQSAMEGPYQGPLYTMEVRPTGERTYRCTSCAAVYRIGPAGDFSTIEVLKAVGCPQCGSRAFRARGRES